MYCIMCLNGNYLRWQPNHPRTWQGWGWNYCWGDYGDGVIVFQRLIEAVDWILRHDGPTCLVLPYTRP